MSLQMQSKKKEKKDEMNSEPAWCALQHIKFQEAVEQWRRKKKGKVQIIRENTKTKKKCSCHTCSDEKCIYMKNKTYSSNPWKRMYDTHYSAWYWHNEITGESQWEKVRGECPLGS